MILYLILCLINIKCGTDLLYERLESLFNVMLFHKISTSKINSSYMTSIIKDKRNPAYDSNNYTGISLSSIVCKVFEIIILNNINLFITSNNYQ